MSTTTAQPAAPIQPMHNPTMAAKVVVPQKPVGTTNDPTPAMGAKALLAKRMAKSTCVYSPLGTSGDSIDVAIQEPKFCLADR
jgi:hypothetical protein